MKDDREAISAYIEILMERARKFAEDRRDPTEGCIRFLQEETDE